MKVTRRQFVKGGVAAFTVTFAAPEFLSDLARAQGAHVAQSGRALPERRQRLAQHARAVQRSVLLQPAADAGRSGRPGAADRHRFVEGGARPASAADRPQADLRPGAAGVRFSAPATRTRAARISTGTDIWSTADPANSQGLGWVGRYLDSLPSPVDPLVGWNTTGSLPHVLQAAHTSVPAIAEPGGLCVLEPERAAPKRRPSAATALRIASHVPVDRPELAFVYGSAQAALATLDRVATVAAYAPTLDLSRTRGFGQALRAVAGAMAKGIGTRVFYVTTGGFDTHSAQNVNATNGAYYNLMATLNDALLAFYNDLKNQGLLDDTLVRQLLGVRPAHHRERQPGHRPRRRRP